MARDRDLERLAREMRGRSPLRGSILLFTILAFLLTAVIWAANTEIDDVTRADGRIVPSASIQVIEASEPGVLEALHVSEGEVVEQGALLMELDGTILDSRIRNSSAPMASWPGSKGCNRRSTKHRSASAPISSPAPPMS